jgi:hypothetical protein
MKSIKFAFMAALVVVIFTACAKVFYSPDASSLAQNERLIAVVPPTVSIAPNKKIDGAALIEQQRTESFNFQKEMYSWLLKRKMQGKIIQEIQDVETTNALLRKAGYPENPMTISEICQTLGVDGILTSNFSLSKPMSEGAAVAVGLLIGVWGSTNEVTVALSINDCLNKKMIFNYNHKYSGSIGSSPANLVDGLMRNASRKMPYILQ